MITRTGRLSLGFALPSLLLCALSPIAHASQAYGSINNFDTVNDTNSVCHGFEIEIDDIRSTSISYTYDYNHYGVPKITEDDTVPAHPKVFVRYQSAKNPNGTWASYTAIPAAPIPPTAGHQFTNPSVNFGGEHFGVGFSGAPTAVKYSWLKDDGAGNLVFAGAVYISTPTFTYVPPAPAVPAQVIPAVVLPPPPAPPALEFGPASWVKDIKTTTHNANKVELKDLVGDDPGKPQPWANGEPSEVETEWRILQTDFVAGNGGGKNNELVGQAEDLPGGNESVTRRYEFYKYVGPIDAETGEAVGDTVGADGKHGVGMVTYADHYDPVQDTFVTVTVDMSKIVVVGDFVGAQMAGFDAGNKLGLIDHVQDGALNVAYVARTLVIGGKDPITTTRTGALPKGMNFNVVTGILSGTPTETGTFTFTVHSIDSTVPAADVSKTYTLTIPGPNVKTYTVATTATPSIGGTTSGDGTFNSGNSVTVQAAAKPGYHFVNWTEAGVIVSSSASYTFTLGGNRTLVANFSAVIDVTGQITVVPGAYHYNPTTGLYDQTVTLTNSGGRIPGPVTLVLDSLSGNALLANKNGVTTLLAPTGSPFVYVAFATLPAGASLNVTLHFVNPTNGAINYSSRLLAGQGQR